MLGINDRLPLREVIPPPRPAATPPAPGQAATPAAPAAAPTAADTPAHPDTEQPSAAKNDAQKRPPGGIYEFHTDQWGELYSKRIDDMIAAAKSKGVPVFWVGMPAVRGTKSTSDMSYLDELYRARAEKAGITYVDIWDGFVDEQGRYTQQGPDFEGQTRRLRTYDGVHFTKSGAEKLAHYVEHELRRMLTNRVVPVALPGPEEQAPAPAKGARPAVGPVVPLGAIGSGEGGELLGSQQACVAKGPDPVATRVLSRGDAIQAAPGRADDFSWPRPSADTGGTGGFGACRHAFARYAWRSRQGGRRKERYKQERSDQKRSEEIHRRQACARSTGRSAGGRAGEAAAVTPGTRWRTAPAAFAGRSRGGAITAAIATSAAATTPIRNLSTAWAAWRPSRIAHTTSDWPRRMSPAANTLSTEVR